MALLVHGDAAFAGLGVTAEAFQMAALPAYSTGGSVHVVLNNQIGFTTLPAEARSSELATDVATAAGFPVIHANADDAEAVVRAMRAALAWRQAWGRDVVVNVCGYRCALGPRATITLAVRGTVREGLDLYSRTPELCGTQSLGGNLSAVLQNLCDRAVVRQLCTCDRAVCTGALGAGTTCTRLAGETHRQPRRCAGALATTSSTTRRRRCR